MRKLLTATTALALVGGAAFAEITISGDGEFGIDYDSSKDGMESKHTFHHEVGIDFSASGTTDGGLSFGGSAGFDTGDTDLNTGTTYVSGAFGKLTIGDNDAADLTAGGIADVGLNGVGVDDVAEVLRGNTPATLRYDNSFGNIALALSSGTAGGDNEHAVGMSFSASGVTVGLGLDSLDVVSLGVGYSTGDISANAFYSRADAHAEAIPAGTYDLDDNSSTAEDNFVVPTDVSVSGNSTTMGIDLSYAIGASKLTIVFAKHDVKNASVVVEGGDPDSTDDDTTYTLASASRKAYGLNVSHDLGGGATLIAGFGTVPDPDASMLSYGAPMDLNIPMTYMQEDKNVASVGLSFAF